LLGAHDPGAVVCIRAGAAVGDLLGQQRIQPVVGDEHRITESSGVVRRAVRADRRDPSQAPPASQLPKLGLGEDLRDVLSRRLPLDGGQS
jgi:hypothetical protein